LSSPAWERIEQMADLKDYNTTCLADAEIVRAKSPDEQKRFCHEISKRF
jgi:hypothetical protein